MVTLLSEMPKPHRKLMSFQKIYYEMQKAYGFKAANEWLRRDWMGEIYMHDADTSTFKPYCYAYDLTRYSVGSDDSVAHGEVTNINLD